MCNAYTWCDAKSSEEPSRKHCYQKLVGSLTTVDSNFESLPKITLQYLSWGANLASNGELNLRDLKSEVENVTINEGPRRISCSKLTIFAVWSKLRRCGSIVATTVN
jgi:hypothetical protein